MQLNAFYKFLAYLRSQPIFKNSVFVYIIEGNYGGATHASSFYRIGARREFQPFDCVETLINGKTPVPAIFVHGKAKVPDKVRFKENVKWWLKHDGIRFHEPYYTAPGLEAEKQKALLLTQMEQYRFRVKLAEDPVFGMNRSEMSGKGRGSNDDVVMTMMFTMFYSALYFSLPKYVRNFEGVYVHCVIGKYVRYMQAKDILESDYLYEVQTQQFNPSFLDSQRFAGSRLNNSNQSSFSSKSNAEAKRRILDSTFSFDFSDRSNQRGDKRSPDHVSASPSIGREEAYPNIYLDIDQDLL